MNESVPGGRWKQTVDVLIVWISTAFKEAGGTTNETSCFSRTRSTRSEHIQQKQLSG